jgi:hypothetical protein
MGVKDRGVDYDWFGFFLDSLVCGLLAVSSSAL